MRKYGSYKDSGVEWIGEIPSEWITPKLKHSISESFGGEVIDKSFWGDGPETLYTTSKQIHKSDYPNFNDDRRTTKRDLLLSRNGDGIVHIPPSGCIYTNVVQLVRVRENIDRRFLWYSLSFQIKPLNSYSDGDFIVSLNKEQWFNLITPLPPLSEQQQIVSYLDTKTSLIDSLIEKTQRKIELLKENRTSLINEVVTKGLNPNVEMKDSGVEWIGEIPSHWETVRLKYVCSVTTGGKDTQDKVDDGLYPFYVRSPKIERINSYSFDGESVLTVGDGVGVGKVFHYVEGKFEFHQRVYKFSEFKRLTGKFFFWFIKHHFIFVTEDQNSKSTVDSLRRPLIDEFPFVNPPLSEQHQIVSYLDEHTQMIDKTISVEERRIELLKEYRQSLISEVVTGKIKP
jgi:type I restriction enzyme S subunit